MAQLRTFGICLALGLSAATAAQATPRTFEFEGMIQSSVAIFGDPAGLYSEESFVGIPLGSKVRGRIQVNSLGPLPYDDSPSPDRNSRWWQVYFENDWTYEIVHEGQVLFSMSPSAPLGTCVGRQAFQNDVSDYNHNGFENDLLHDDITITSGDACSSITSSAVDTSFALNFVQAEFRKYATIDSVNPAYIVDGFGPYDDLTALYVQSDRREIYWNFSNLGLPISPDNPASISLRSSIDNFRELRVSEPTSSLALFACFLIARRLGRQPSPKTCIKTR